MKTGSESIRAAEDERILDHLEHLAQEARAAEELDKEDPIGARILAQIPKSSGLQTAFKYLAERFPPEAGYYSGGRLKLFWPESEKIAQWLNRRPIATGSHTKGDVSVTISKDRVTLTISGAEPEGSGNRLDRVEWSVSLNGKLLDYLPILADYLSEHLL